MLFNVKQAHKTFVVARIKINFRSAGYDRPVRHFTAHQITCSIKHPKKSSNVVGSNLRFAIYFAGDLLLHFLWLIEINVNKLLVLCYQ